MASCTVNGNLKDSGYVDVADKYVRFRLKTAGTDSAATTVVYGKPISAITDANGDFSATLWVNGDSDISSLYEVKLPNGETYDFIIPTSTTTIEFDRLLALYQPDGTVQQSTVLDQAVQRTNHTGGPDDMGGNDILDAGAIQFSTSAPSSITTVGTLKWNNTEQTLDFINDADSTLQLGQELWIRARNSSGAVISDGEVVRVNGAAGNRPRVVKAQADSLANVSGVIGLATASIANNADGFICVAGSVRDVNTSGFTAGDMLYVDASTAGALTATEPAISVAIGVVTVANAVNGKINVQVDGRLPDIEGITPTDSIFIVGNGSQWVGESGATARTSMGLGTGDAVTFSSYTANTVIRSKSVYTGTDTTDTVQLHMCDSATAFTLTVADGTADGSEIKIINRGAGTVTLSGKISTITAVTELLQGETTVLNWDTTDDEWQ